MPCTHAYAKYVYVFEFNDKQSDTETSGDTDTSGDHVLICDTLNVCTMRIDAYIVYHFMYNCTYSQVCTTLFTAGVLYLGVEDLCDLMLAVFSTKRTPAVNHIV